MLGMLEMLKIDRSISTTAYDERLSQYLVSAQAEIVREGYTFSEPLTVAEMQIIVALAGWMWDQRTNPNLTTSMPRSIKFEVVNMIFAQKMREEGND